MRYTQFFASLVAAAPLSLFLTGCNDDFGHDAINANNSLAITVSVPDSWHSGVEPDGGDAAKGCVAISQLDGDTPGPLYLHSAVVADTARVPEALSRGTMVNSAADFHEAFSLSAICFTGEYPADEKDNHWTPNFAYNVKYGKNGERADGQKPLMWPGSGAKIKFFAFAPHISLMPENSLALSPETAEGSPALTYTVPENVTDQTDLMAAVAETHPDDKSTVNLEFHHILAAIQVKASLAMIKCRITKVTLSGIYGKGTYNLGSGKWTMTGKPDCEFSAQWDDGKFIDSNGNNHDLTTGAEQPIVDGAYTFLLLPQQLSDKSTLTIELSDILSGEATVISAPIGKSDGSLSWQPGSKWTYTVSASSISVEPVVAIFSGENDLLADESFEMPYTGVLYDATIKAYAKITQAGVDGVKLVYPTSLSARYRTKGSQEPYHTADFNDWMLVDGIDPSEGFRGTLNLQAGSPFELAALQSGCITVETGQTTDPVKLEVVNGNETANCYMIDQAGYYSLPLVYGNAIKGGFTNSSAYGRPTATGGISYYVKHDNQEILSPDIAGADNAILVWQDSPDLVRDVRLRNGRLQFHIDGRTIAQGNALLAVRDRTNTILWSWHIWVTTAANKSAWLDKTANRVTPKDDEGNTHEYFFTPTNLGYCYPHEAKPSREVEVEVSFKVPVSAVGYKDSYTLLTAEKFHLVQANIEKSMAGDNPYYQWGRKDPIPPGIYWSKSEYDYGVSPSNLNNIRRKPLFNVHEGYESTRTPVETKHGVDLGYAIQHPNEHILGRQPMDGVTFDYRGHWHNPGSNSYIPAGNIMFNVWNASETSIGKSMSTDKANFHEVTKTVYDPSPPGFHIPPVGAFLGLANPGGSTQYRPLTGNTPALSTDSTAWTVKDADGNPMEFYALGLRDMNLKNEVLTLYETTGTDITSIIPGFYDHSWCSFNQISYVTSATISPETGVSGGYQVLIFVADTRQTNDGKQPFSFAAGVTSKNSYGLSVRPIKEKSVIPSIR